MNPRPEMISKLDGKWSPLLTANDPNVDRKWSQRKTSNGMEFGSIMFITIVIAAVVIFIILFFILSNDNLRKEKILSTSTMI